MELKPVPYQRTVFVCTNVREDKVACGNPDRGGQAICHALKKAVKATGIRSKIRVARSGCLDRCAEGPNLFVYPEGAWFSGVAEGDITELVQRLSQASAR